MHAAGVGAAEFDYDGAGRLVSVDPVVGDGVVYGYDAAGRLAETVRGAVVSTRGYDGDGGLRVVGGGAGSTVIDWDPVGVGVPLGFQDGGGSTNLVGVDGRWAGAQQGSGLVAFDVDVFGSVGAGGGGGGVAAAEGYDVFGNPVGVVGVDGPRLGFRGELHVAGDIYLRARTYSPGFGAFLTPDPLDGVDGTPTVANPYHYADNDPLNKTDPTGLRPNDGDLGTKVPGPDLPCTSAAPGFLANGSRWNHQPDPGGATAQFYSFSIPRRPAKCVVRINGFIQQDSVTAPNGAVSVGDGRTFDSNSTARESRMSIELDFERGVGQLFVNYTCHLEQYGQFQSVTLKRSCHSANPIGVGSIDIGTATNWSGFNEFSHKSDGDELELRWNFVEPTSRIFGVAPCGIVGKMTVDTSPSGSGIALNDRVMRDFPSFEVYQYFGGRADTLLNKPERDLPDLCAHR